MKNNKIKLSSGLLAFISDISGFLIFTITQFILIPKIIENVGNSAFGYWLSLVAFFGILGLIELGSNQLILTRSIRLIGSNKFILNRFISESLQIKIFLSILTFFLGLIIYIIFNDKLSIINNMYIYYLIWSSLLVGVYGFFLSFITACGFLFISNILNSTVLIFTYIVGFYLIKLGLGINAFTYAQLFFGTLVIIFCIIFSIHLSKEREIVFKFSRINLFYSKKLFFRSFEFSKINFSQSIFGFADHLIIGFLLGAEYIVIYFISIRISSLIAPNITRVFSSIFPYYSWIYHHGSKTDFKSLIVLNLNYVLKLSIVGTLIFIFLYEKTLILWMGEDYLINDLFMYLLTIMVFRDSLVKSLTQFLMATGEIRNISNILMIEAILKIFLSIFLIYFYGIIGAIIAQVLSTIILSPMITIFSLKNLMHISVLEFFQILLKLFYKNNFFQIILFVLLSIFVINFSSMILQFILIIFILPLIFFLKEIYIFLFLSNGSFLNRFKNSVLR